MHFKYSQSCLHNTRMLSVLLLPYKKRDKLTFYVTIKYPSLGAFFFLIGTVFKEVILSTK